MKFAPVQFLDNWPQVAYATADDRVGRRVLAGDFHLRGPFTFKTEWNVQGIQQFLDTRSIEADRQHAAGSRDALLKGGAMEDQTCRIGERERARCIGRSHFARAVAQHAVRIDTPGLECLHQCALDGENCGLGQFAFVERRLRRIETGLAQGSRAMGAPLLFDGIDCTAEHRMCPVEFTPAASPLRPLSGEHHQQPRLTLTRGPDRNTFRRERFQRVGELSATANGEGSARRKVGAASAEIAGNCVEVLRLRVEHLPQAIGALRERIGRARRERNHITGVGR